MQLIIIVQLYWQDIAVFKLFLINLPLLNVCRNIISWNVVNIEGTCLSDSTCISSIIANCVSRVGPFVDRAAVPTRGSSSLSTKHGY